MRNARLHQLYRHLRTAPTADRDPLLPPLASESHLLSQMTTPSPATVAQLARADLAAPILLLGVSGKMGPSLAVLLKRAGAQRVIGVARFSDDSQKQYLEDNGVETIAADLLADGALAAL